VTTFLAKLSSTGRAIVYSTYLGSWFRLVFDRGRSAGSARWADELD
jgi:hypothetical protein